MFQNRILQVSKLAIHESRVNGQNTVSNQRCLMKQRWISQILGGFFPYLQVIPNVSKRSFAGHRREAGKHNCFTSQLKWGHWVTDYLLFLQNHNFYPAGIMWVVGNNGKSIWLYYRRRYSKAIKLIVKPGLALQKMISNCALFC